MCKQYQIEYTCHHTANIETSYCSRVRSSSYHPNHSITIHPQRAPHKCRPCRNYDRDRWRRGRPPIPLPPAPAPAPVVHISPPPAIVRSSGVAGFRMPRVRFRRRSANVNTNVGAREAVGSKDDEGFAEGSGGEREQGVDAGGERDGDDFAVDFAEEGAGMGGVEVEHVEDSGGVGLGLGLGLGYNQGVVMSGGLNGGDTGSSEGFGLAIDGAGSDSVEGTDQRTTSASRNSSTEPTISTPTTPTRNSTDQDLINKMRAQSFAEGVESGIRNSLRSRFGGYGGRKLRERRSSTVEMGGVPMERTTSNRGSLALTSPRGSTYRGADMEGGGGSGLGLGLGLNLGSGMGPSSDSSTVDAETRGGGEKDKMSESGDSGLGMGFGGVAMERGGGVSMQREGSGPTERDGGVAKSDGEDAKTWLRRTRRESVFSTSPTTITSAVDPHVDGTGEDDIESVTARFLDF